MEYENLWNIPNGENPLDTTSNIVEIMRQQGKYLKEGTNGKVFGKFNHIKNLAAGMQALSRAVSFEVVDDPETSNLDDANKLYGAKKYGFEIYNNTYKFRVFEMLLTPVYPVNISLDEGIVEDTQHELINSYIEKLPEANQFSVKSDDEFLTFLRIVFSSKKVRYIIQRLQSV